MEIINQLVDTEKKLLILGAHQDDAEFSCGRLLLKRKGVNSHIIYFTDGKMGQIDDEKVSQKDHANGWFLIIPRLKMYPANCGIQLTYFLYIPELKTA